MNIFKTRDTAAFLRAHIARLPKKGRGEISRIANHLRVSTTLVSQVLAKTKNFTPEQGQLLVDYLGLQGLERDYVIFLIHHDRAGTAELKKFWQQKLISMREQSLKVANRVAIDRTLSEAERSTFYSNPLFSAIRLYSSVGKQGKTIEEIAQRFNLSRAKTKDMLTFLTECGLCKYEAGRYMMGPQKTHLPANSPHALRQHTNWRLRTIRQLEDLRDEELAYSSAVSLSRKDFEELREEMLVFIQRFLERVHASPAEDVAYLNLDFLWVRN